MFRETLIVVLLFILASPTPGAAADRGEPWPRHAIDASSRGADGVRLADVNGDGFADIATGWEEGGKVRLYVNPGPTTTVTGHWPAVTVGEVGSPEDAVLVDLDGDGELDVVSSCEGGVKTIFVHWAPSDAKQRLESSAWRTEPLPASRDLTRWMFAVPAKVDGENGVDLVVGSKNPGGVIGWFESPENPRELASWRWHPLYTAGWIMTIECVDMDGDGDLDILASDRKGETRGCLWLEHPGVERVAERAAWTEHRIGGGDHEVMFSTLADIDGDGARDLLTATRGKELLLDRRRAASDPGAPDGWSREIVALPDRTGTAKATGVGDIDLDGRVDLVFSCENSKDASGVLWLSREPDDGPWRAHEISGPEGVKFDLIELIDLDGDGDLDVLTCEERENLGVIWYENPTRRREKGPRRPWILITNDDGVRSDGLRALVLALEPLTDVMVVAPATNVSGASQSVTLRGKIAIEELDRSTALGENAPAFPEDATRRPTRFFALGATPASCVHVAMSLLSKDRAFDLVASGINRGQNIGADIQLSGTVGAARMAADNGVPALALSLSYFSKRFSDAARLSARIARHMLESDAPPIVLNVNFPGGDPERWKAPRLMPPGASAFRLRYTRETDESGKTITIKPVLGFNTGPFDEGTDIRAFADGHVTITRLGGPARGSVELPAWIAELESWDPSGD